MKKTMLTTHLFVAAHRNDSDSVISDNNFVCLMSKINESHFPRRASSWICDSGCTAHMTHDRSLFKTYEYLPNASFEMGTKATTEVVGRGDITLKMQCGSTIEMRKLENVLHIPSFEYSLLSVSAMDKRKMKVTFGDG